MVGGGREEEVDRCMEGGGRERNRDKGMEESNYYEYC